MVNLNNICIFEGRITSNQKYSQFQGQNGPVDKVFFSVSVPRILSSQQKQDPNAKKNDFVNFSLIGGQVKTLQQYFPAGTPIKVFAKYQEYETVDNATGQKKYGHVFEVDNISFVTTPSQNQQGANNNNYQQNGGYNNAPQRPTAPPPAPSEGFMNQPQQPNNQQGNFQMFNEEAFPF